MKINGSLIALLILMLFALHFLACNGEPPPPPPPECGENEVLDDDGKTCVCIDGYERNDEGDCVEIPPPPPPPPTCAERCEPYQGALVNDECRCSSDYYTMTKAESLHLEAQAWDSRLINNGVRGPEFAYEKCGDAVLPYNGFETWDEIFPIMQRAGVAKEKLFGLDGMTGYYSRLLEPNRHFGEGRSTVYKPVASPWFDEARALLNGTGTEPSPNGPVSRLDGIKGKCENILGLR